MKLIFQGIAVAAASGLLMGAAFKPSLTYGEGPLGPQLLLAPSGERHEAFGGGASFAAYGGEVPDYVLGTDWTEADAPLYEAADYAYEDEFATPEPVETTDEPVVIRRPEPIRTAHAAPEPVAYPSTHGGIVPVRDTPEMLASVELTSAPAPVEAAPPAPDKAAPARNAPPAFAQVAFAPPF